MRFSFPGLQEFTKIKVNNLIYFVRYKSSLNNLTIIDDIKKLKAINSGNLIKILQNRNEFYNLVIYNSSFLFISVDQISSHPLIYNNENDQITVIEKFSEIDLLSLKDDNFSKLCIKYSGYTLSNRTLFQKFNLLKPGEVVCYENNIFKKLNWINLDFKYGNLIKDNEDYFNEILIKEFEQIKKLSKNKKIIVPLSAGLDSRLIVSILSYLNFKNVETFTYGFTRKRDQLVSQLVLKKLNFKHTYLNMNFKNSQIYKSNEFKSYISNISSVISSNNPGEFGPINILKKEFDFTKSIILNGQTGDFISGNHIPLFLFDKKNESIDYLVNRTLDYIIFKHFNLWSEKKINNDQLIIRNYIKKNYFVNISSWENIVSSYEKFEFENRQVKWVVGQQKVYDYFGLNWSLPLWSTSIMNFFMKETHIDQRKNQSFYKEFLIKKNYGGVWKKIPINPKEKFSIKFRFLRLGLKLFFLFLGKERWKQFEKKYLYYFMDQTNGYYAFDYLKVIKTKKIARNSISFYSKNYLIKNFNEN